MKFNTAGTILKSSFWLAALLGGFYFAGFYKIIALFFLALTLTSLNLYLNLLSRTESIANWILRIIRRADRPGWVTRSRAFLRTVFAFLLMLLGSWLLFQLYQIAFDVELLILETFQRRLFYLTAVLIVFFYSIYQVRRLEEDSLPAQSDEIKWFRVIRYFSILLLLTFLLDLAASVVQQPDLSDSVLLIVDYLLLAGIICLGIIQIELVLSTLKALIKEWRTKTPCLELISFSSIEISGSRQTLLESFKATVNRVTGIDISRSRLAGFFIRIFEPVLIFAIILVWFSTALVIVNPQQEAVFRLAGRITEDRVFGPGIYFKLPWPFTRVELYDSKQIRSLDIGFVPDPDQKNMIWTKSHTLETFDLIVGDGVEMIAIDCQVLFRINDLYKYLVNLQNPDEYISAAAYKLLTRETVAETFDDIIARDRENLSANIQNSLQQLVEEQDIGVEILEVVFLGMHPPLTTADAFEDVISAQIDRITFVLQAKTTHYNRTLMTRAVARSKQRQAESDYFNRLGEAVGESQGFISRSLAYEMDPDLTRFRRRLEITEKLLSGRKLYLIDKSLARDNDRLFFNIQKQPGR